jgi:uncharacterized lipoprotein YajG
MMIQIVRPNHMIRKILALIAILAVAACSVATEIPANDCPREGGIGGTGDCTTEQSLS